MQSRRNLLLAILGAASIGVSLPVQAKGRKGSAGSGRSNPGRSGGSQQSGGKSSGCGSRGGAGFRKANGKCADKNGR